MIPFSTQYNILKFLNKIDKNKDDAVFMQAPSVKKVHKKSSIDLIEMSNLFVERGLCSSPEDFSTNLDILVSLGFLNKNNPCKVTKDGQDKMDSVLAELDRRRFALDLDPMKHLPTDKQLSAFNAEI